jgi:hypothetical protein
MTINENLAAFHGRKVIDFEPDEPLPDPAQTALRIGITYDGPFEEFGDAWSQFLESDGAGKTVALIIGNWSNPEDGAQPSQDALEILVASADRLPNLRALFFGDITSEENEISWIEQSDVSALWGAFPRLEELGIRGGNGLQLGRIKHATLKILRLESGGLPRGVVASVAAADLPALEHLELWLGTPDYNGNSEPADLAGILDGTRFPRLQTLALRNCEWADELAAAVASAPILARVKRLDLSMGTLGDKGADALIASPAVRNLQHIDISHHYVSDALVAKLRGLGVDLKADERLEPETDGGQEFRYVAVSE